MATETRVGWGVIGACGIARRRTIPEGIVPASNAKLVAVMDINQEGAKAVAEQYGAQLCADVKQLLRCPGVQAVYIGTPNYLHKEQVLAAARGRKHVLCEKPLALRVADIRKMIAACQKANVLLGVGLMMRFNVYHQKFRDMVKNGELGVPVFARGQMTCWYPPMEGAWRQIPEQGGGGVLMDVGPHVVDILEMFFGRTRRVYCRCLKRVHPYAVEDVAVMMLEFESGLTATADFSFAVPDEADEYVLEVYGSKGAIKAKYTLTQGAGGEVQACLPQAIGGYDAYRKIEEKRGYQPFQIEPRNTYRAEIEAFSQAVLEGRPAPVPAEDALWNQMVIEAAYKSARTGKPVQLKTV